jgi:hypothetical protein
MSVNPAIAEAEAQGRWSKARPGQIEGESNYQTKKFKRADSGLKKECS